MEIHITAEPKVTRAGDTVRVELENNDVLVLTAEGAVALAWWLNYHAAPIQKEQAKARAAARRANG